MGESEHEEGVTIKMADVLTVRNRYRLEQWAQVAAECQASGVSNRQFCQERGISEKTYYYWLRKLRAVAAERVDSELVRLEDPKQAENASQGTIKMHYHDAQLEIPAGADRATIAAVLTALNGLC